MELADGIGRVTDSCEVERFEVAMVLLNAYRVEEDMENFARVLERTRSTTVGQAEIVHYRGAEFYIATRDKEKARPYVQTLKTAQNRDLGDAAEMGYACAFERCATVTKIAERLSESQPNDEGLRLHYAFSLADRHEFKAAAEQFDIALQHGALSKLDSRTALVAIASYSNAGRKDRARELLKLLQEAGMLAWMHEDNVRRMKLIVGDPTDKQYYFSVWPITGSVESSD